MPDAPQISVIIPTYQRRASLERALRALCDQSLAAQGIEVMVVVDGSDDGTQEMVAGFSAPYSLKCLSQANRGRAVARNAGMLAAAGEVLVILDDDMEPAAGMLAAHLHSHPAGSRLGVMGPVPIIVDKASPAVTRYVGGKFNEHLARLALPGHVIGARDVYCGNFSIRREIIQTAGMFDEDFTTYGNEDVEYGLRLVQAGVRLVLCPQAIAYQHYEKAFADLATDQVAKAHTALLLAAKHPQATPKLKLGSYYQAAWRWRIPRAVLLACTRIFPGAIQLTIGVSQRAVNLDSLAAEPLIAFVLDYCFWASVQAELKANTRAGRWPASLSELKQARPG